MIGINRDYVVVNKFLVNYVDGDNSDYHLTMGVNRNPILENDTPVNLVHEAKGPTILYFGLIEIMLMKMILLSVVLVVLDVPSI